VSDSVPPFAAVSTSVPETCVQEPAVPRRFDVEFTAKIDVFTVCEPLKPVIVTVEPVARLKLDSSVIVIVFGKPAIGVLCSMDLTVNIGTATVSGSIPLATPYNEVPYMVIAASAIEPTTMPFPSWILADTLTDDNVWAVALFFKMNVTVQDVSDGTPPESAVNPRSPGVRVHTPAVPRPPDVDVTAKDPSSVVCDPVSPEINTVEYLARSQLAFKVTVIMLSAPDTGVLCSIDFTLKVGTTTNSGLAPFATPNLEVDAVSIAADENVNVPDASIATAWADWAASGLVIMKENV
jgi:hypothetical protein